jgi:CBS domain-containing protein
MPSLNIDPRVAALVGMAALFAGASRALLASVVFAFETTLQPLGLLPLLGGCTAAYFVSSALMRNTIMTAKISRRGVRVPAEYVADFLDQVLVGEVALRKVVCLSGGQTLGEVRRWIGSHAEGSTHQGFPVVDDRGQLIGVVTRRDLLGNPNPEEQPLRDLVSRSPITITADSSLRMAADRMVSFEVGRLPVVDGGEAGKVIGIVTRSDLLHAHRRRLREAHDAERSIRFGIREPHRRQRDGVVASATMDLGSGE